MESDEIEKRHKAEQKQLQEKIQGLKNNVPKGDKKQKRQVTSEIAKLQMELDERHSNELKEFNETSQADKGIESLSLNEDGNVDKEEVPLKMSKAQKRREKKETEARERAQRIAEGEKESEKHSRNVEAQQFEKQIAEKNLKIVDIYPDGNCLYNSVIHALHNNHTQDMMRELREKTSKYMLKHEEYFIMFTTSSATGEMMNHDEYGNYCEEICNTNTWGGQLEIRAISQILEHPIEILQATTSPIIIGEEFSKPPLRLSYHRHQYGLGEHYNAVVDNT